MGVRWEVDYNGFWCFFIFSWIHTCYCEILGVHTWMYPINGALWKWEMPLVECGRVQVESRETNVNEDKWKQKWKKARLRYIRPTPSLTNTAWNISRTKAIPNSGRPSRFKHHTGSVLTISDGAHEVSIKDSPTSRPTLAEGREIFGTSETVQFARDMSWTGLWDDGRVRWAGQLWCTGYRPDGRERVSNPEIGVGE